jgi:hypothetical protein
MLSESDTADTVTVAAFTAYSKGVLRSVAATTVDLSTIRPSSDVAKVVSITMTDAGVIAAVEGTDGTDTSFSEVYGEAGAPPLIPADSVLVGQARLTSSTSAVLASGELYQNGQYTERSDFPTYELNPIGEGSNADNSSQMYAHIEFSEALEGMHTGGAAKATYVQYYIPSFSTLSRASDFVPAEISHSVSSEEYYNGSINSTSESLGQATFTALCDDGVSDLVAIKKNTNVTVRTYPNRNKSAYMLTQGLLGISREFPVDSQISADCTISTSTATADFS